MRRFFFLLYAVTAVAQLPLAWGVAHLVGGAWGVTLAVGLTAFVLFVFRGRVALARWDRPIGNAARWLVEEPFYVHWCASLLAFAFMVIAAPVALVTGAELGRVGLACQLAALPWALWGVVFRRRWVRVRAIDVAIPGLPPSFDGYRIAQLTDLHLGSLCPRARVEGWIRRVNALEVDLVALTGDYVTSGVRFHRDIADVLATLRARDGVFAVMGNHDYYGDGEPLMTLLAERDVRLLRNERVEVRRGDATLVVAGVDDVFTRRCDVPRTMQGLAGRAVIVLAHDPRTFPELADHGASLVLSGHTHWGQVGLPWFADKLNYAHLLTRFASGLHRRNESLLYVSPGLGTTGPPVRVGTWPEITVLCLRCD